MAQRKPKEEEMTTSAATIEIEPTRLGGLAVEVDSFTNDVANMRRSGSQAEVCSQTDTGCGTCSA